MENISLSLPRRSFSSNTPFTAHKSVYDDVFGGPPKLGLPTLAPRFEDYSEIFGGFHTSHSSSIPVLHLPIIGDNSNLLFDVDYIEVFGGCEGFGFTASPEDLVGHSTGGYDTDSSGDPWSPAQSGFLSDELDPVAGYDKSQRLSDGDSQQSLESINTKNASYNKSCHMSAETVLTASSHVNYFSAVPGYTFSLCESPVSWDGEDEHSSMGVIDNIHHIRECGASVTREKQYKCSSNPSCNGSDTHVNDYRPVENISDSTSLGHKPFVTVSDISLRTKPSQLPPPSRPPPVLVDKRRERDKHNSELRPCQHYASDRVADDNTPLYFDMEIDGTISAEDGGSRTRNVKVNNQVTKELTGRKYFFSLSASQVEEKTNETVRTTSDTVDENFLRSCVSDTSVSAPVVQERIETIKSTKGISGPREVQYCKNSADDPAEAVSGREAGYFEEQADSKRNEDKVEIKLDQKDSPKRMNVEKVYVSSGNRPEENYELKENVVIHKDAKNHKGRGEKSYMAAAHEKSVDRCLDWEKNIEAGKMIVNECQASGKALEEAIKDKDQKLVLEMDEIKKRNQDVSENDNKFMRFRMAEAEADDEEAIETSGNMKVSTDTRSQEELNKHAEEIGAIGMNGHGDREVEWDLDSLILIDGDQLEVLEEEYEVDEVTTTKASQAVDDIQKLKYNQRAFSSVGNGDTINKPKHCSTYESETGIGDKAVIGRSHELIKNKDDSTNKNACSATNNSVKSPCLPNQIPDSQICGSGMGVPCVMSGKISPALGYNLSGNQMINSGRLDKRVNINENFDPHEVKTESIISEGKTEDVPSCMENYEDGISSKQDSRTPQTERKVSITKSNLAEKDQKVGERIRRETEAENEHMRKLEEEKEREREREKDRMAVDKAALEARERSYFEVRSAVERATAEVRQRSLAEVQDRLEKTSIEARIRAERAAVERATAEARQRAAEKLMAHKAAYDPNPIERSVPDRFSACPRYTDSRQSFMSPGIHFQGTGVSNHLRYPYSSAHDGAESESPQRCKARLERYRRTAERAANALAEKNRRDLLAQREREERTRVAESLDTEVKRWSSGKEGNLRALLSTLQYILGPDSGWHPVSLTEVITSAAVKKAYRRATLCVHPDKLQQRGATIQQKYVCEKVFDLLKEAWNKFNSEER